MLTVGRVAGLLGWRGSADDDQDADFLEQLRAGDHAALAALYDRYATPVYSLALRMVGNQADAEDVTQDVFLQAWSQAARYDAGRGPLVAWLFMIARSRAFDRLRARGARPNGLIPPLELAAARIRDPQPPPDVALLTAEQAASLKAALETLPFLQRVALELAYYEGLSQSEIADRLEEPIGTVKTRIRLGLRKLRAAIVGEPT